MNAVALKEIAPTNEAEVAQEVQVLTQDMLDLIGGGEAIVNAY